jgi:micrococcal nuclease
VKRLSVGLVVLLLSTSSAFAQLVTRVVDGDTIHVEGVGSVRLIGIDTPETVDPRKPVEFFAKEAGAFTNRMVQGKVVRLEFDFQRKDKYDRTLAYVYLPDGTFVNAEIVKQGYSHAYTTYPFKYLDQFRTYEREARAGGRGLWGAQGTAGVVSLVAVPVDGVDGEQIVYITKSGTKYHLAGCRSLARSQIPIALKNVGSQGPCGICQPPVLEGVPPLSTAPPSVKANAPQATPTVAPSASGQCQATTKAGKRCSRKAQAGSSYCWQHGK